MILRAWSGRARAIPTIDILASVTFIISVPVEMSENRDCTRAAGRHTEQARRGRRPPDL
jgi:hypothetical protein